MKYLNYITGLLNDAIREAIPCERGNVLGLAQLYQLENAAGETSTTSTKRKLAPGVYRGDGEVEYAGFDDRFDLVSYHRALSMTARKQTNTGYGDDARVVLVHNMSLVIFADQDKIGMNADQLALSLQFIIPERLAPDQLPRDFYGVTFNLNATQLSADTVFRGEFQGVEYFLGPRHLLVRLDYTVESTVNKKCFRNNCRTATA